MTSGRVRERVTWSEEHPRGRFDRRHRFAHHDEYERVVVFAGQVGILEDLPWSGKVDHRRHVRHGERDDSLPRLEEGAQVGRRGRAGKCRGCALG
jgi:hypothetical protein